MKEGLRQVRRHTWALLALALVPLAGTVVNLTWPPDRYAYIAEMLLLLSLAVGALALARSTVTGAVFLYCSLALLPVGAMLEQYQVLGGGFSALLLIPHIGILTVAVLSQHYLTTFIYGIIAAFASLIYGGIYNDLGQAGTLFFLACLVTFVAVRWVECSGVHIRAEVERLQKDTGELGAMVSEFNQMWENLNHDP